jgi:hypothetical protein
MRIEFDAVEPGASSIQIGERTDELFFVREGSPEFKLDPKRSTASAKEFKEFYSDMDSDFTEDTFLKFHLKGLLDVARSGSAGVREWLSRFLESCADSAEAKQLKALLVSRQ